jgi:hypothetical protein
MSRLGVRLIGIVFATATLAAGGRQAGSPLPAPPGALAAVAQPSMALTRTLAFTTIQGNALDSANTQLVSALVRLRDARYGRIVSTQLTDSSGMFVFRGVDPGSYIVELVGNDSSVLAASDILNVNAGESLSAIVRLPFRASALTGAFGARSATTAAVIIAAAAATGVVAVIATRPVSPIE